MTQITVSADLARQIVGALPPIVLVDESGRRLGEFTQNSEPELPAGVSPEYWDELVSRMETPGAYSTLEEIKKRHGWDRQ